MSLKPRPIQRKSFIVKRKKLPGFDFKTGLPLKRPALASKRLTTRRKAKDGTWTLKKADTKFSEWIRARDGKCMHPRGTENCKLLQNSHYIGRAVKSTRYDPDNCITICWFHHYKSKDLGFEYQKQIVEKHGFDGQYTIFMRNLLGSTRFLQLIDRSKLSVKQKASILAVQKLLSTQEPLTP